ncbi:excinuclease ABC subunit UvrB [bacterium]|jgi:excinuclease ABC subunit B|nr:excinuclease ABC subunit UvrB [bacterium]
MDFKLKTDFTPSGDQPKAIDELVDGLTKNVEFQTLLGVTGSGKTFTIANVIEKVNRPTLVIAHNKTLAAQLCSEFQELFPDNAVEYFVSYYDYYQPEAYIPSRDVYIEKEADINEEIERLRHKATQSLLTRRDVIIVASVSCIYGLGLPEDYASGIISLKVGQEIDRKSLLLALNKVQFVRNDTELTRGKYRVRGDIIDVYPSSGESLIRLEFFGDEIEKISDIHPIDGHVLEELSATQIFPATHYVIDRDMEVPMKQIKKELEKQVIWLTDNNKPLEAHRIEQRTRFDLEMMREVGYCKGIENYSRHLAGRQEGEPSGVLMDFFPDDFLTVIDESHATLPQIRGMYNGDRARKGTLVDFGFRLPSAKDNRPLTFDEFEVKRGQVIYVSATPGPYELEMSEGVVVEQIIRPTGLLDPQIEIRPTDYQIDNILHEIHERVQKKERVLITALTKKSSEELTDYLKEKGVRVQYLHSDIKALERVDILHALRAGKFDVLVGVNLLREGLDLPEVSLVAILDADKEGFLRNERSLIQTIGRASRNKDGKVLLYANKTTESMKRAVDETNRRRKIQDEHNKKHGLEPMTIIKKLTDIREDARESLKKVAKLSTTHSPKDISKIVSQLRKDMKNAAKNLEFELAAVLRDQIEELSKTKRL